MKKLLPTVFLLMASSNVIVAQGGARPIAKIGGPLKNPRMIELSNMMGETNGCVRYPQPIAGTIVRREFDDDEITIVGIVLREANDERTYINIDGCESGVESKK